MENILLSIIYCNLSYNNLIKNHISVFFCFYAHNVFLFGSDDLFIGFLTFITSFILIQPYNNELLLFCVCNFSSKIFIYFHDWRAYILCVWAMRLYKYIFNDICIQQKTYPFFSIIISPFNLFLNQSCIKSKPFMSKAVRGPLPGRQIDSRPPWIGGSGGVVVGAVGGSSACEEGWVSGAVVGGAWMIVGSSKTARTAWTAPSMPAWRPAQRL